MSKVLDGFEDFNRRVRLPLGFRIRQPARERVFLTASGSAEFSSRTDARCRAATRTIDAEHRAVPRSMEHHHLLRRRPLSRPEEPANGVVHECRRHARTRACEFDLIDITSFARDGSTRSVYGYRALAYNTPRGSVFGYMPELNLLCAIADHSEQSGQPLTKHLIVEVTPAVTGRAT